MLLFQVWNAQVDDTTESGAENTSMTPSVCRHIAGAIHRGASRSGTSLVEAMVSILVLAVAVIGTASFLFHAHSAIARSSVHSLAVEVSASRLEELTSVTYADLASFAESDKPVLLGDTDAQRSTQIASIDEDGDGEVDYARITVTVTWGQTNGIEQQVDVVTLRSQ